MGRRIRHPAYLRLRRWVDRDLGQQSKPFSFYLPLVPLGILGFLRPVWAVWAVVLPAALAWYVFVIWRTWRLAKVHSETSDRQYDEHDKFLLPPEYADTESVGAARRRRRREGYRKRRGDG